MRTVAVQRNFESWRNTARRLLQEECPPGQVFWQADEAAPLLFANVTAPAERRLAQPLQVPRYFVDLALEVCRHRSLDRFALLYRVLWRITHGERNLLAVEVDSEVRQLLLMRQQVIQDRHRMLGFLRFEKVEDAEGDLYFAWYQPDHYALHGVAPQFARKLRPMRWSILTPDECASWDTKVLRYAPGIPQKPQSGDQLIALWQTYYAATYNPQRDNPKAFRRLVPTRFLQDLPETGAKLPRKNGAKQA